ncbi:MAG: iron-containing alcohol dehydrogenase [Anaerolineae bacterium]|nr:iron-containing alcohol dehydrogenase [Anaerolineae bacterium]
MKDYQKMSFTFATANRIIFGDGTLSQARDIIKSYGERVLIVVGTSSKRTDPLLNQLNDVEIVLFSVATEPTIPLIEDGVRVSQSLGCTSYRRFWWRQCR